MFELRVSALLPLLSGVMLVQSCINDDYDMLDGRLDMEITAFEQGMTLPLGSTEQISFGDLLEDVDSEFLEVAEDGSYSLKMDGSFDTGEDFSSLAGLMNIPDVQISPEIGFKFKQPKGMASGFMASAPSVTLEATVDQSIDFNIIAVENVSEDIVSLGLVELEDTYIDICLDASSLPLSDDMDVVVDIDMHIPDVLVVSGASNGICKLSGRLDGKGFLAFEPIVVEGMDFTGADLSKDVNVTISLQGAIDLTVSSLNVSGWVGKSLAVIFNMDIMNIGIKRLECKVDYGIPPVYQSIDMSGFSNMLGGMGADASLDFCRAMLDLNVVTNLGLPVNATVRLIPYYDGIEALNKVVEEKISLNVSESSEIHTETKFSFDENKILNLVRDIPERIGIELSANTDPEKTSILEPKADYDLTADYSFEMPLEFGEHFSVTYRDTIPGLPAIVSSLLVNGNKLVLAGEIENSLPLGLDLKLNFLDSDGRPVPSSVGSGVQKIAPCGADGESSKTELNLELSLSKGARVSSVDAIELVFKADSEGMAGTPVKNSSYLQATLKAVLPEGITFDIEDIIKGDKN